MSVTELDVDLLFRHFSRPKGYLIPMLTVRKNPPPASEWNPRLVYSSHIAALYAQEPWKTAARQIAPISFLVPGGLTSSRP